MFTDTGTVTFATYISLSSVFSKHTTFADFTYASESPMFVDPRPTTLFTLTLLSTRRAEILLSIFLSFISTALTSFQGFRVFDKQL